MIYLDNAATTMKKPPEVIAAVVEAMNSLGNSSRGTHATALSAARTVYQARVRLAELFHCPLSDNVVFTANSTEALNIALAGIIDPGDHVITTDLEHNSVLRPLYRLRDDSGVRLSIIPADEQGRIEIDRIHDLIEPRTRAIVCTHASNLTGDLVDIGRVGAIAQKAGVRFIVDASQTAGIYPIDMVGMNISVVCFTGHKGLMGPQGTGGLCIAPGVDIRPWIVGGTGVQTYSETHPAELPTRLEAGTLNAHGIAGLSAAVDFIRKTGMDTIRMREQALMRQFYDGVRGIAGVTVYGDFSAKERAAIVSLNIRGFDSGAVADILATDYDIATRPGGHCAPRLHQALGTTEIGAVRFSFSWYTEEAEVAAAIRAIRELAEEANTTSSNLRSVTGDQ